MKDLVIEVKHIKTLFGENVVHREVSFSIERGSIVALIGGSGTGKSVLLREIIRLLRPTSGEIEMFGVNVWDASPEEMLKLSLRFGMLFQDGALFSTLNVGENVAVPILERMDIPRNICEDIVALRLSMAGLSPDVYHKMPSELSGGMRKRVALARALALEPEILFLDEPTSGLDPINARSFDHLVQSLNESMGLTIFMVTHDLDTLLSIPDRIIVLDSGIVLADGNVEEVQRVDNDWVKSYFSARAVVAAC